MGKDLIELSGRARASISEAEKAITKSRRLREMFAVTRRGVRQTVPKTWGRQQGEPRVEPAGEREVRKVQATMLTESASAGAKEPSLRERQVICLIAEGNSNKKIGSILAISTRTVETYRARVMEKLDVHTTAELVRYAIRENISRA